MLNVFVLVWPDTALANLVKVYELASPLPSSIGALIAGVLEPLDVKSISSVVSNNICESIFEAICNPLSIEDGASP